MFTFGAIRRATIGPAACGVPGTKSDTTVRLACAVPPSAAPATTLRTVVPPVTATGIPNEPSPAAAAEVTVVAEPWSVLVAETIRCCPEPSCR